MYHNYKIVVNTAAGRRRYMQYLVPPIIEADIVDRYDIWVNTHNMVDIEFFKQLAEKYPKVNLVWQPDGIVNGIASINAFYRDCCAEDTIYMKLDDDVVWFEPKLFEKMVKFRVDNPEYFLVSPLVINNALSTYLLQVHNKIKLDKYYMSICMERTISLDGWFAADLHNWFMDNYLIKNKYNELYVGKHPMGMARFSINCILWFGKDMAEFKGIVPGDDEEFLSCVKPTQLGKCNCFNGDALIAHFAFGSQREGLDKMDILSRYGKILHDIWGKNERMSAIDRTIQNIIRDVESKGEMLSKLPSPYKKVPKKKQSVMVSIAKKLPEKIRLAIHELTRTQKYKFIER